ncbi:MAG: hypothetical protein ACRDP8_02405 [Actinopolymorphaceae bacterium]
MPRDRPPPLRGELVDERVFLDVARRRTLIGCLPSAGRRGTLRRGRPGSPGLGGGLTGLRWVVAWRRRLPVRLRRGRRLPLRLRR